METRICKQCGDELPLTKKNFKPVKCKGYDRVYFTYACKKCIAKANRVRNAKKQKEYRKERMKTDSTYKRKVIIMELRKSDPEKADLMIKENDKIRRDKYYKKYPEKIVEIRRKYEKNNRDSINERLRNDRKTNPQKWKVRNKKKDDKRTKELPDHYIIKSIKRYNNGLESLDIPKELIEQKRLTILIKRELKTMQS
jgi:hypothetical protein